VGDLARVTQRTADPLGFALRRFGNQRPGLGDMPGFGDVGPLDSNGRRNTLKEELR
jgi:hypothetical protein